MCCGDALARCSSAAIGHMLPGHERFDAPFLALEIGSGAQPLVRAASAPRGDAAGGLTQIKAVIAGCCHSAHH
jgi:hypothetical protein